MSKRIAFLLAYDAVMFVLILAWLYLSRKDEQ